jgi:hypothetical protein
VSFKGKTITMDKPFKNKASNTHGEERRKSVRYPINGLVQFQWRGADGQSYDAIGTTCDIGRGGVFIESDSIPPVASVLKLIVTLPAESKGDVTLQLGGIGVVLNVRRESRQAIGFGASTVFHVEVPTSEI